MLANFRPLRVVLSLTLATSVVLLSSFAWAQGELADREPDRPPPATYRREYRRRPWEAVAGGAIFALSYAPMLEIGFKSTNDRQLVWGCEYRDQCQSDLFSERKLAMVPALGPLLLLGGCGGNSSCRQFLLADAAFQIGGLYLLVDGLINRSFLVKEESTLSLAKMSVAAAPLPGGSMVALSGVF